MKIPKASDADKEYFRSLFAGDPEITIKPMFGNLGAFVNGNMFAGLFGTTVGIRLGDEHLTALRRVQGVGSFGPAERPMTGYAGLPPSWRDENDLTTMWILRAQEYVSALPPKKPRTKR